MDDLGTGTNIATDGSGAASPASRDSAASPASGESAAAAAARRRTEGDPAVFVIARELAEVHLLLDNVSANPTTTVNERDTDARPAALGDDWIERVCEINWPPQANEDKAKDAALLLSAKDYLNHLSHPASGSTIAFTLLVTQEEERAKRRRAGDPEPEPLPEHRGEGPSRASLAEMAYPDLIGKALHFRRAMLWMSVGLAVVLVITCMLSWYVAYGNAALAEYTRAQTLLTTAQERVDEAETAADRADAQSAAEAAQARGAVPTAQSPQPVTGGSPQPATGGSPQPGTGASPQPAAVRAQRAEQAASGPYKRYCNRPASNAAQAQACSNLTAAQSTVLRLQRRLGGWVCVPCWNGPPTKDLDDAPFLAAARANIMGSAVLPFLYGLLGAGAAIIRSLSRKIRASLLSPRDLNLSFQQLALGAVIGAVIGMFVAAPNGDGEGLLGPISLSASAISFIAGFGVEAVFQAIEALITRIFNLTTTPAGNRGDGVDHP